MNDRNTLNRFLTRQFHARWRHLAAVGAPLGLALGLSQLAQAQDPKIMQHPTNQTVYMGANVVFRAAAMTTNGPISFQWQRDDPTVPVTFTNIPSANRNYLNLMSVTLAQAGDYRAIVANAGGDSVTSQVAHLEVAVPPFIKLNDGPIATDRESSQSGTWCDYDGNGFLDLFVANGNPAAANSLYHQEQDGSFARVTNAVTAFIGDSYAGLWADYDDDGDTDLLVAGRSVELFRNDGDGQLLSANLPLAIPSGVLNGAWADVDGDGWLDLFLTDLLNGGSDYLLLNRGDGDFRRLTAAEAGPVVADGASTLTAAFCDYDNDGDPDLFVGYRGSASWLYRNLGAGKFEKVQVGSLPVAQAESGIWADFNNDGYFDLFTTTSVGVLHRNLAGQGFEDVTEAAFGRTFNMTVWGAAWGDYDNDGDLDLFIPDYYGPNLMFRNNGDGTLTSIDVGSPLL